MSKLRFIAYCVMISFFLAVWIFGVVFFSVKKTPDFEELKTEECTFVKQKYYPWWSEILDIESRYDIYVEEREKPFVISRIVFKKSTKRRSILSNREIESRSLMTKRRTILTFTR